MPISESANQAVFLSYASQDALAVERIAKTLRAAGVEVWFDQNELVGGDAWDAKIRKQIAECALFVPVISANTQARLEGYFRIEWKLAAQRTHAMAEEKMFLLPVVIDATRDAEAKVPAEFRAVQWTRLPNEAAPEKFCERVKKLLGSEVAQASSPAGSRDAGGTPALRRQRRSPRGIVAGILIVGVVAAGVWKWLPRGVETSTLPKPAVPAVSEKSAVSDKSLVVLPLENLSPDPENAFFTDGMHAEIIATLQRIPDLKVISRDSAVAFKGSAAPLAEKAQKVGVAHAITGNVRRAGTSVRIQLELRRARDEAPLWTQTYDKELGEGVIAIQSDIADQVARVLQARERKGTYAGAQFMTKNAEAYDLFLKARQTHYTERLAAGRQKAIAVLEQALVLDPAFSSAARLLATALVQAYLGERNPAQRLRYAVEAKRWAETARRLLPGGAGDDALASYYNSIEPDNARALSLAENAVKALPSDAAVLNTLANTLAEAGQSAEAVSRYRQAISLDPANAIFRNNLFGLLARLRRADDYAVAEAEATVALGTLTPLLVMLARYHLNGTLPASFDSFGDQARVLWLQRSRREAEALPLIETALAAADTYDEARWNGWIQKCVLLRRLQRVPEAVQAAQEAKSWMEKVNVAPAFDVSERDWRLAVTLAGLGRADEAAAAGRRYVAARSPENQVRSRWLREVELAELYSYLGRPRECVELLAKLLRVPSSRISVPILKVDPTWDNVRDDAGFKALLADPKNSAPL